MNLSIKSENPAICLKEELENLKEGLQDIDFEKYLKNYYYVEQNKSYDLLVSKFWGGFWIEVDPI